jgi:hypothetical protein
MINRRTAEIRQRFSIASLEHSADFFCSKLSAGGRIMSLEGTAKLWHGQQSGQEAIDER